MIVLVVDVKRFDVVVDLVSCGLIGGLVIVGLFDVGIVFDLVYL